eukprot:14726214-Alexandrium_andersonii.AAC.1
MLLQDPAPCLPHAPPSGPQACPRGATRQGVCTHQEATQRRESALPQALGSARAVCRVNWA